MSSLRAAIRDSVPVIWFEGEAAMLTFSRICQSRLEGCCHKFKIKLVQNDKLSIHLKHGPTPRIFPSSLSRPHLPDVTWESTESTYGVYKAFSILREKIRLRVRRRSMTTATIANGKELQLHVNR